MEGEIGRKRAVEYELFSKPAELLADKVLADSITAVGAAVGIVGSYFLAAPEEAIRSIEQMTGGKLNPTKSQIKTAGAISLGASYVCDLLDGTVARKSETGETFHGRIFDGIANKAVEMTPAVIFSMKAKGINEKATWLSYLFTSPMATMIRSRGIANDVPISKAGLAARVGRTPPLIVSLLSESKRGLAGKLMTLQSVGSAISRYKQIKDAGDETAIGEVNKDLLEYTALFVLGRVMFKNPLQRELLILGLELAKLGQVKFAEAKAIEKRNQTEF